MYYHQHLPLTSFSRLPAEVLVCRGWHSGDLQQLDACAVPLWAVRPEQDGHLCCGRKIPQRRPRWRAEGQCRLAGEGHPLGILKNDCSPPPYVREPVWVIRLLGCRVENDAASSKSRHHSTAAVSIVFILSLKRCLFLTGLAGEPDQLFVFFNGAHVSSASSPALLAFDLIRVVFKCITTGVYRTSCYCCSSPVLFPSCKVTLSLYKGMILIFTLLL